MAIILKSPGEIEAMKAACVLSAQVLREEAERCAQLTEQAAAALLRGQPLRKELWREPCTISILGDSIRPASGAC